MANVKTRIIQKHDSSANWAKATTFVPLKGEIIIYDDLGKIKIGDGAAKVNDLPFANEGTITGIKMNGASKGTSGVVDLGTVITAHQDISGKQDKLSTVQLNAVNSGITSAKVEQYNGYNTTISNHTTRLTTLEGKPGLDKTGTVSSIKINGTTKTPTNGVVDLGTVITSHQSLDGKQDKLTAAQLNAVNSGITSDKVKAYDGYSGTINKQGNRLDALEAKPGLDKVGTITSINNQTPDSQGNIALNIPSPVSEATVSGWGFTKNTGTYSKPSGGIPKTDLASAVQTSLTNADNAVKKVKINGAEKAPTNGVVDLGNILPNIILTTNTGMFVSSMSFTQATGNEIFAAITKLGLKVGSHFMLNDGSANWANATIYSLNSTSCTFRATLFDAAQIRLYNFTVNNNSSGNSIAFSYLLPPVSSYNESTRNPVAGQTIYSDLAQKVNTSTTIAGKALTSNISAADLRTALNVENGANKTIVESYFDANSTHPIENQLITKNFQGVKLDCDLNQLWQLNTECELQTNNVIQYVHALHHEKLTSGRPAQIYLFDDNGNIYTFDGANPDDLSQFVYLFHTTRYENDAVITYNLTIKENNGMVMLTKADNSLLCFDVDTDIFNGAMPTEENYTKLFNWVQTNNLHKTFASFNISYQKRIGTFFVQYAKQIGDNTYEYFILVGGGFGNPNNGLVEIVLTVSTTSNINNLENNYFAKKTDIPNTNSFVKTSNAQTITGQKTFSQTRNTAPIKVINWSGDAQNQIELEIRAHGLKYFYNNGNYYETLSFPEKGGADGNSLTLATTDDLIHSYKTYTRSTSGLSSSSYSTAWNVLSQIPTEFKVGRTVIFQISSGPYGTPSIDVNKSVFVWYIDDLTQGAWNFQTETSSSTSYTNISIDGGVNLRMSTYANDFSISVYGRNGNSTPLKLEYWVLGA